MFRSTLRKWTQINNSNICYNPNLAQYVRPKWKIETKSTILNEDGEPENITNKDKWLVLSMQDQNSPKRARMAQYMTLYQMLQTDMMIREDLMSKLYTSSHHSIEGFDVVSENELVEVENDQNAFLNPTLGCGLEDKIEIEKNDSEESDSTENLNFSKFEAWKKACPILNSTNFEQKFTFQDDNIEMQIFLYPYNQKNYSRTIDCFSKSERPTPEDIDVVEVDPGNSIVTFRYRINTILNGLPADADDQTKLAVGPVIWTCKGVTETENSKVLADPIKHHSPTFKFLLQTDDVTVHNSVKLDSTRKSATFSYDLRLPQVDEVSKEKIVYYDVQPLFVAKWEGLKEDGVPENRNFELMDYGVEGANDKRLMPDSKDRYFLPRVFSFPAFRIEFEGLNVA